MENLRTATKADKFSPSSKEAVRSSEVAQTPEQTPKGSPRGSSLIIGAKTLAGIGIGLLAVVAGTFVIGAATEAVLIPSLLAKLAGGIAGGGVGMAKGIKDAQKVG